MLKKILTVLSILSMAAIAHADKAAIEMNVTQLKAQYTKLPDGSYKMTNASFECTATITLNGDTQTSDCKQSAQTSAGTMTVEQQGSNRALFTLKQTDSDGKTSITIFHGQVTDGSMSGYAQGGTVVFKLNDDELRGSLSKTFKVDDAKAKVEVKLTGNGTVVLSSNDGVINYPDVLVKMSVKVRN